MLDRDRPDKQSEARIDPAARQGMRRFLGSIDADGLSAFVRDCLRAVDRKVAAAIFNEHVMGLPMPASSDRGRIAAVLRGVLRAGRPDGFECLQGLTTQQLETALDDDQYEVYSEAVDALNEAVEGGEPARIAETAGPVVEAMRAGMDDEAIERFVRVHALPETIDALMAALAGEAPAARATAGEKAAGEKAAGEKAAGEKAAGEKAVGEKAAGKKAAGKKTASRKSASKMGSGKPAAAQKVSRKTSSTRAGARKTTVRKVGGK